MKPEGVSVSKMIWVILFAIAFAFVEASVVVYLRAIYYPEGFTFPLKMVSWEHLTVELVREGATIVMLAASGMIAGRTGWQKFGYFLISFGVWDILYYVWLKVILDWPSSLTEWDVLFLIPIPWIGPVIAPLLVAVLMTVCGFVSVSRIERGAHFRPTILSWLLSLAATVILLYSFMLDIPATLRQQMPQPYAYELLVAGLLLYIAACITACKRA